MISHELDGTFFSYIVSNCLGKFITCVFPPTADLDVYVAEHSCVLLHRHCLQLLPQVLRLRGRGCGGPEVSRYAYCTYRLDQCTFNLAQ